jgi:nucleoid-associated protein YgaU
MTRETKIGLLVGLAFIIVIGVLLSDHIGTVTQPPPAQMDPTKTLRDGVSAPGGRGNNQGTIALGEPRFRVPLANPETTTDQQATIAIGPGETHTSRQIRIETGPSISATPGNGAAGSDGGNLLSPSGRKEMPVTPMKQYTAEPGDTVSKIALKFLGSKSKANLDAIVEANPSLKANPNKIVVGEKYNVPETGSSASSAAPPAATAETAALPATPVSHGPETTYMTKPGDTLWKRRS